MLCEDADYNDEYNFIKRSRHESLHSSFIETRKASEKYEQDFDTGIPFVAEKMSIEPKSAKKPQYKV